jgi:poly(3-hydroxybutyrate) depolymerase
VRYAPLTDEKPDFTPPGLALRCLAGRSGDRGDRPVACGGRPGPAPTTGVHEISSVSIVPARQVATSLLLYVPPDAPPGEKLPTVLYLHGGSQRGSDLRKLESYGLPRLLARGLDFPFIVIAPQLPEGEIWSDADFLVSLLDELSGKHPIDPDRTYVTGMSMGARGAWYLAYRHPDRVAAIVPLATFQPVAFWATSGRLCGVAVRAIMAIGTTSPRTTRRCGCMRRCRPPVDDPSSGRWQVATTSSPTSSTVPTSIAGSSRSGGRIAGERGELRPRVSLTSWKPPGINPRSWSWNRR